MKEAHEYRFYRARCLRPYPLAIPKRLWGKWVRVARWTKYGQPWLIRKLEAAFWPLEARQGALNRDFEIEGSEERTGPWEPVSEWRRRELRRAREIADELRARRIDADGAAFEPERPGRPAGSGVGMLVRHLRDVNGLTDYDELLLVLRDCGLQSVVEAVEGWGEDARSRLPKLYAENGRSHKRRCPYCESGLPAPVRGAIDRRKITDNP